MKTKFGPLSLKVVALIVAAALVLVAGGIATTRAALTERNEEYRAEVELSDVGVAITENGVATDTLLENLLDEDESLKLGYTYDEVIAAENTDSADEYIRIVVKTYWMNEDDSKNTELEPSYINLGEAGAGWTQHDNSTSGEEHIYYYGSIVGSGASTGNLFETLTIDVAAAGTATTTEDNGIYTTTYEYDGCYFVIEAEAQAVQATGDAAVDAAAMTNVWGYSPIA